MEMLLLQVFAAELFGLLMAAVAVFAARKRLRAHAVAGSIRTLTALGAVLALVVSVIFLSLSDVAPLLGLELPLNTSADVSLFRRFLVALVAGVVSVAVLVFPVAKARAGGSAELSRRTPLSFGRTWWFIAATCAFGLTLLLTVGMGLASSPDEEGRYTMYMVDLGAAQSGTSTYGWYYSLPGFALVLLLCVLALVALVFVARPPLRADRELDVATRRWRTGNILAMTTGALLLHVAALLGSLAGTASSTQVFTVNGGALTTGGPFAALEGALGIAAFAAEATAYGLWFFVLLAAAVGRRRDTSVREA